jgi:hypothetical protein
MDHITELTLAKIAAVIHFETLRDEAEGPMTGVRPGHDFPINPNLYPAPTQSAGQDALAAVDALRAAVDDECETHALDLEREAIALYLDGVVGLGPILGTPSSVRQSGTQRPGDETRRPQRPCHR